MGMTYPELYAAIGVHSGLACGAARDLGSAFVAMQQGAQAPSGGAPRGRTIPTIVFHGDADTTVNPRNGDAVLRQVMGTGDKDLRASTEHGAVPGGHRFSRTRYVDPDGTVRLEQWTVHDAGHAWSGGSPAGSYTDPRGPDAGSAMIRFFLSLPANAP
jgi:poly(3-hydroxybutyrate) depolymerase